MKFIETIIKGCYVIELTPSYDERGGFVRTFCKKEFITIGHTKEFVQFNQSYNTHKGTIRGMHYQNSPFGEIKLVRCVRGGVLDVVIDIRQGSPTYLKHFSVELNEDNKKMIYIPEGIVHGFQTLKDNTELVYHHTEFYNPQADAGLNFADPVFQISWPLPVAVISKKDRHLPFIDKSFRGY